MKIVNTTEMVCHLWANQSQHEARNQQGTLYFKGDAIYSYGNHFPMARHAKGKHGPVTLITTQTYSLTTTGHMTMVRQAIRDDASILYCHDVWAISELDHMANLERIEKRCRELLLRAAKGRTLTAVHYKEAQDCVRRHLLYRKTFGLRLKRALTIPLKWKDEAKAQIAKQAEHSKQVRLAKEENDRLYRIVQLDDLESWKRGMNVNRSFHNLPVVLRVVDYDVEGIPRTVETSRGAQVPALHARRIWKLVCTIRATGKTYERNGHTEHVGAFTVDSIDADGTLRAGCHVIEFEAMKDLADRLGWPVYNPMQIRLAV